MWVRSSSLDALPLRVLHGLVAVEQADLAGEDDAVVGLELLGEVGLVEPDDAHRAGLVADGRLGAGAEAEARDAGAPDADLRRLLFVRHEVGDCAHVGEVVVAVGEAGRAGRARCATPSLASLSCSAALTPLITVTGQSMGSAGGGVFEIAVGCGARRAWLWRWTLLRHLVIGLATRAWLIQVRR